MDNLLDQGREMLNSLVDQRNVIKVQKYDMNVVKYSISIAILHSFLVGLITSKFIVGISTKNA